jgi:Xaa-Pro aminopeptidase
MIMSYRLEKLRQILVEEELDAILISQGENRRYLSGFTGSAGFLLISQDRAILATDSRYIEQAQAEAPTFEVVRIQRALSKWLPPLLSGLDIQRLGFEGRYISFLTYRELTGVVGEVSGEISLVSIEEFVESLRAVKDRAELECLEKAAAISDAALEEVLPGVQPGISERELAWELESFMRRNGSEPLPFDIIVASGPNSALPHAKPTNRAIRTSEPVMIDLGANVGGYFSDITRTICHSSLRWQPCRWG